MSDQHFSEAYRPLVSFVAVDPESLPTGTAPTYTFRYIDIASATQGRLLLPDDEIECRDAPSRARRVLRDQDVIMSTVRPNLKAFAYCRLPPGNFVASTGFAVLRSKEDTDPRFVLYSILSDDVTRQIERFVVGSNYPAINSSDVKRLRIPNLSPGEQQRIGEILSTVDEAIEQTEALIAKTQQIKAGLMHDLFTRGVTEDGQIRPSREAEPQLYRDSPIGWLPVDWSYDYLRALTTQIVDGTHHTPAYKKHGVPFITVKNLTSSSSIDFSNLNYISQRDHEELIRRVHPKPGDVLVTKDGTLGVARLVEAWHPAFSIFVSVALLRTDSLRLRPRMLHSFFDCGVYKKQLGHLSAGTGLKHIHLEHFRRFVLPLPDVDEQDRIAKISATVDARMKEETSQLYKFRCLKQGLMHDLFTGNVSVAASAEVKDIVANV